MKRILFIFVWISIVYTQNSYDVLRPFWGFDHSQILSNGIGDATVASGYITPGLSSNPANLAATPFTYFQMNLSNAKFNNSLSDISKTGFNGLDFVQPIPVYKGSFVISAGAHKIADYMLAYKSYNDDNMIDYYEKGNLSSYHIGAAVEFAKRLYIGADLKLLRGNDEMTIHYNADSTDYYSPNYSGFSFSIGLLHNLSKNLQYGISIDMPTSLQVEEPFVYSNHLNPNNSYSGESTYHVKKPFTLHAGLGFLSKFLNLFYEAEYTDWNSLEFSSKTIYEDDLELLASININKEIREQFNSTLAHHMGIAIRVPFIPLHLFSGYQIIPFPEKNGHYGDDIRENYSMGFSLAVTNNVSIQGLYNTCLWEFKGNPETYDKVSIGISFNDIPRF